MTKRTRFWILLVLAAVVVGVATFGWFRFRERSQTGEVQVEGIERRDLVATVAASGQILWAELPTWLLKKVSV